MIVIVSTTSYPNDKVTDKLSKDDKICQLESLLGLHMDMKSVLL